MSKARHDAKKKHLFDGAAQTSSTGASSSAKASSWNLSTVNFDMA
jgi:hypothetical protein